MAESETSTAAPVKVGFTFNKAPTRATLAKPVTVEKDDEPKKDAVLSIEGSEIKRYIFEYLCAMCRLTKRTVLIPLDHLEQRSFLCPKASVVSRSISLARQLQLRAAPTKAMWHPRSRCRRTPSSKWTWKRVRILYVSLLQSCFSYFLLLLHVVASFCFLSRC